MITLTTCEAGTCTRPARDDDPLVDCEYHGILHDSCHLTICQSRACHRALYGEPGE